MAGGAWDTGEWDSAYWDSLPITGNSSTGGIGSLNVSQAIALNAEAAAGQVGTATANVTITISGVSAIGSVGLVAAVSSQAIGGNEANGAVGSITQNLTLLLAGISAFGAVGTMIAPAQPEIMLGGHFGFDERDKQWEKNKQEESKRRERLHKALFDLPLQEQEKITTSPITIINVAAQSVINYDKLLTQIRSISAQIEIEREEEDMAFILEMM